MSVGQFFAYFNRFDIFTLESISLYTISAGFFKYFVLRSRMIEYHAACFINSSILIRFSSLLGA